MHEVVLIAVNAAISKVKNRVKHSFKTIIFTTFTAHPKTASRFGKKTKCSFEIYYSNRDV